MAVQQDGETEPQEAMASEAPATPPRRRRQAEPTPPIELDPQFIHNPERMQYALLLALLLRLRGTARFSAKDMAPVDTDYNILFARTLDGKFLEVTVVSAESGIIRSPENAKEAMQWIEKSIVDSNNISYQPLPQPPQPSQTSPAAELYQLHGMDPNMWTSSPSVPTIPTPSETKVMSFPTEPAKNARSSPIQPADGSVPFQFPFQTGDRPETAEKPDLAAWQAKLLHQDRQLAAEEQAAIERQENS